MELTDAEGRVLGCLAEKQLTTPQLYPLTDNALIAACNQTTNRDPVVAYDVATVRMAVRTLREKGLLRTVHRTGERSDKHQHLLETALPLPPGQVALLAVLLLRGPQTLAELRAHTDRMHPFDTVEQAHEALTGLADRDDPLVRLLVRQPGQKEARYTQFVVETEAPQVGTEAPQVGTEAPQVGTEAPQVGTEAPQVGTEAPQVGTVAPQVGTVAPQVEPPASVPSAAALSDQIAQLRAEVAELRSQVDRLWQQQDDRH